jgi:hypothetical protein
VVKHIPAALDQVAVAHASLRIVKLHPNCGRPWLKKGILDPMDALGEVFVIFATSTPDPQRHRPIKAKSDRLSLQARSSCRSRSCPRLGPLVAAG